MLAGVARLCGTARPVALYPSSGTGAWEAALVNTLSPGDRSWRSRLASSRNCGYELARTARVRGRGRAGRLESRASDPAGRANRGCRRPGQSAHPGRLIVHNETSTGVRARSRRSGRAIDRAGIQRSLIVDAVSSLASIDVPPRRVGRRRHGLALAEGHDAAAGPGPQRDQREGAGRGSASQPATQLLGLAAGARGRRDGLFPYTPATNLLFGLREALAMFDEEGLPAVFSRHARHAEATRRAVRGWGLDIVCQNPDDYSSTLTAVMLPNGLRRGPGALG